MVDEPISGVAEAESTDSLVSLCLDEAQCMQQRRFQIPWRRIALHEGGWVQAFWAPSQGVSRSTSTID